MRIVTYGKWKGNLWLDGHLMENPNGDHNYTYNTKEDEDEVICVLHLHQGKTNMIVDVNDGQADRGEAIYKVLENGRKNRQAQKSRDIHFAGAG